MHHKHFVCARKDLLPGQVRTVELRADLRGQPKPRPRQAVVLLDEGGDVKAYLNECMHIAIPLDLLSGDLWSDDKKHLRCLTHGALYRLEDGYCVHGPCVGQSLEKLEIEIQGDSIYVCDRTV